MLLSAVAIAGIAACGQPRDSSLPPIDLIRELPRAERRATHPIAEAVRVELVSVAGDIQPALVMVAPARLTYSIRMPARATLRTRLALLPAASSSDAAGVTIRVGVSDDRFYDELVRSTIDRSAAAREPWRALDVDLSAYSGWKWSLFNQPGRRTWKLILNADAAPGGAAVWARPVIEMR